MTLRVKPLLNRIKIMDSSSPGNHTHVMFFFKCASSSVGLHHVGALKCCTHAWEKAWVFPQECVHPFLHSPVDHSLGLSGLEALLKTLMPAESTEHPLQNSSSATADRGICFSKWTFFAQKATEMSKEFPRLLVPHALSIIYDPNSLWCFSLMQVYYFLCV